MNQLEKDLKYIANEDLTVLIVGEQVNILTLSGSVVKNCLIGENGYANAIRFLTAQLKQDDC